MKNEVWVLLLVGWSMACQPSHEMPTPSGGAAVKLVLVSESIDLQAAHLALVTLGTAVLAPEQPLPETIRVGGGVVTDVHQAAALLAALEKPVSCESHLRESVLQVDCFFISDANSALDSGRPAELSVDTRRVLRNPVQDSVLVLAAGKEILVRSEGMTRLARDYQFNFPHTLAGRRGTWAERRRGGRWVIEVWAQQPGVYQLDDGDSTTT